MNQQDYSDLMHRIKRIESRLVQLMYYLGARLNERYEPEMPPKDDESKKLYHSL